jgi:hypothetical protein
VSESARTLGTPIDDGSDRRRSLSFLAFSLLLFVMAMSLLFVRGEVKRADQLDALEPVEPDGTVLPMAATDGAASHRRTRRRAEREHGGGLDVSPLDVPIA